MPIIAEVRFTHEHSALADTFESLPGCEIAVVQEASTTPGRSVYVFRFDGADAEVVRETLEIDHTVAAVEPMPGFETDRLVGVEFTDETMLLAPDVTQKGGFVIEAQSSGGDDARMWHERWLLPDGEALHEIWQHAQSVGFEFTIVDIRQQASGTDEYEQPTAVSDEQREALVAAYESGYFDEPRESSLEELAERLELSPTAVAGRLRRGMEALVGSSIGAEARR